MPFFVNLLIGLALNIIAYLLTPKPKGPKPPEAQDAPDPVAEAGKPIPVVFGTISIKGLNLLWFGDKRKVEREVPVKGGKKG